MRSSDARRRRVRRSASGAGARPSRSSRARMKRSISLRGQVPSTTGGTDGWEIRWYDQCDAKRPVFSGSGRQDGSSALACGEACEEACVESCEEICGGSNPESARATNNDAPPAQSASASPNAESASRLVERSAWSVACSIAWSIAWSVAGAVTSAVSKMSGLGQADSAVSLGKCRDFSLSLSCWPASHSVHLRVGKLRILW